MSPEAERPGLYLHLPFCSAICPYCDFAVLVGGTEKRRRFVRSLLDEIALHQAGPQRRERDATSFSGVDTIYLGGGTPSLIAPENLGRILDAVRKTFAPLPATRISLEANPEDVDSASLEAWRRLGVDTLSLGVQSFEDAALRFLGRRHDVAESVRAVELALDAGFESVSVDLIYGLPGQDAAAWRQDLERAADLRPHHLSCYELEIHERTTFGKRRARGELNELPGDTQAELFFLTHRVLEDAGYDGYELSNFARSSAHRSRHNQKYWRHVPYLGFGPSAHSFDGRDRWWNERSLPRWDRAVRSGSRPEAGRETLGASDLALETVMLGLRTAAGVDLALFEEQFGFDLEEHNRALVDRLADQGFLRAEDGRLTATLEGWAVADGLASAFEVDPATMEPKRR